MAYTVTERYSLAAAIMASSMVFIDSSTVNIALPAIQSDLDLRGSGLLWVTDAYLLTLASLMLTGGSLGDMLGRNRIFSAGLILFTLASVSCGLSFSSLQLIISRLVQGIGGALLTPGSLAVITTQFSEKKVGGAIGLWSTFTSLTSASGPLLGGWLAESGLWRIIFFINIPLSVTSLWIIWRKVPETRNEQYMRIDYPGAILITLGLAGLAYGLIESSEKGFGHTTIIFTLAAGMIMLGTFVYVERRTASPLMPLHLFKSVNFSTANGLTLVLYGALSTLTFFLPLNLVQIQGYSEWQAGMAFFPMVVLIALLSPVTGNLVDRYGARLFLVAGPFITGSGLFIFGIIGKTTGPHDYWATFFLPVLLMGAGMGITVAPLTTTVMRSVKKENSGTASGINNSVSRIAGLLFIALLGTYALHHFRNAVIQDVSAMDIPRKEERMIAKNTVDFAKTDIPSGLSDQHRQKVRELIRSSFVESFDNVAHVCAGAAWLSSLLALIFIRRKDSGEA